MSREPIRVAVIGQGFMGRAHSFAWTRAASLETTTLRPQLAVLCGRDRVALERNAAAWGFPNRCEDWKNVVRSSDVDLVDICTPGASHAEIAAAALEAGKHVLCEKPLANSLTEAEMLATTAARAAQRGVFAMVGFNYRRVPALAFARSLIAAGRLGTIRHVRAAYLQDWLVEPSFPITWRLDRDQAGSGALGDLGAHIVDLVNFLTDDAFVEVVAQLQTFVGERPLAAGESGLSGTAEESGATGRVTVDDAFTALGRLEGGALVTLEATRMAPGRKNFLSVELNGSAGSLRFDLERLNELEVHEAGSATGFARLLVTDPDAPYLSQWWPPGHVLGWEHSFVHEVQDLLMAIAEARQPEPSFAAGLVAQSVLDAIARSAEERRWVALGRP